LSQLMSAHGDDCLVAYDGGFPARAGSEVVCVDPRDGNAVARLVGHGDWTGVIHLWSMDQSDRAADEGWLEQVRLADRAGVVSLVQALIRSEVKAPPRLWLVTRGAQPVGDAPTRVALAAATLWGLGRVIALEHPELRCTRVDLDGTADIAALHQEILA